MPRNDASFAIFTFALQIRRRGKHAVAFVSLPVTHDVTRLTSRRVLQSTCVCVHYHCGMLEFINN